ncbi:hypothetical protein Xen7305DRAFT_00012480 [Xenococcus sp. PCC 7305]|uniref:hypothetical protein n=1 Tax=Xenococcus sp. PCC 7305 TaxID=102125 RepID=UPI0002AD15DE|nr:hypothetical protein [Xenococcus sp. PCC 7305]ELS01544.1 hypothetical protein Xen7305DRAFT_00012480 [Xenococcus sp. PCC 7305]
MTNTSDKKQGGLTLIIASVIFLAIISLLWALLNYFPSFTGGITPKQSALTDLGNTIVVFSFVSLALQSSLGVFVSNWRGEQSSRKTRLVSSLNQDIGEIKALINPTPVVAPDNSVKDPSASSPQADKTINVVVVLDPKELAEKKGELKTLQEKLEVAQEDLGKYRDETKAVVSRLSLLAGVVISLGGIRILQSFADVSLVGTQLSLFNSIDVLLTGGLLAGGSAGVHRLTKVYEEVTNVDKQVKK